MADGWRPVHGKPGVLWCACKFCNGRAAIIRDEWVIHEEPVCRRFRELSKEAFELMHADAERIPPPGVFLLEDVTGKCPEEGSPN